MSKFGFDTSPFRLALVTGKLQEDNPQLSDTIMDHALRYADLGWYVVPVRKDKKPLDGYGLNSATKDPSIIRNIWTRHPGANIAIACEKSGLVVLDIDPRNGGNETLARLEAEHGLIYSTIASVTQSGGEHRVFKAEPGVSYPGTMGAGLDLKHNGYILVEPSVGESGVYKWQEGKDPTQGSLPIEAPVIFHGRMTSTSLSVKTRAGSVAIAPAAYEDLRNALSVIPPETPYDEGWFKVLQGMSRLSDTTRAYEITRDWSCGSSKSSHNLAVFNDKWRACLREDYRVGHQTVFYLADQHCRGWRDVKHTEVTLLTGRHPLSLELKCVSGASNVTPIEYVYDRFMSTGVNIIAGAAGVGKTTLVVPMALAVAHLCPADHPMKPRIRRNVIIVTESVVQVQRVVYSLAQWGYTGMASSDFEERVAVLQAHRLEPEKLAQVAAEYAEWTVDNVKADGSLFRALPLVVLDTANAVLELENENDNSEVGRAMSVIKIAFAAFPLIIVAHMAKTLGFGESEGIGSRGASAWTGDAQGVYTVFKDGEHPDSPRVLKASKVRFPTRWPELTFELVGHTERHPNILGEPEDEHFMHSIARPLEAGQRAQFKEDNKEKRQQDEWVTLCDEMIDLVRQHPEHSRSYYEQLPKTAGGPKGSQERKERAMTSLIGDGCIKIVMLDKPKGRSDHYLRVDDEVVDAVNKGRYQV